MHYCFKNLTAFVHTDSFTKKRQVAGYGEYTCVHYPIKFPKHDKLPRSLPLFS